MVQFVFIGGDCVIKLDYRDNRPIYEQIKEEFKKLIVSGALKEEDKIPSVRELASSLAINPNTIQRGYHELELEGFIYSQRAKGYFVAPITSEYSKDEIKEAMKTLKNTLMELCYLEVSKEEIIKTVCDIYEKEDLK